MGCGQHLESRARLASVAPPGSASNSTKGNLGDPHALRPCNPGINSSRGNKPFGNYNTTGVYGHQGANYFPGDTDKGNIARSLFYSATRYQSTLTLVNGTPSGDQMGDLASLLRWHYVDPPDEFERRRNHAIYSSALNPSYYTNNRNAYVDRPEFAWSVFGGGNNDSTLYVGGVAPPDGASFITLDLGAVITGAAVPAAQPVTLYKDGANPTYYAVTPAGEATSSLSGAFNAFDVDPQVTSIDIGLATSTATSGQKSGTVTIDNLDVSSGGSGQGAADGDDIVTVILDVLDHAEASFSASADQDALTIDFGTVPAGSGLQTQAFGLYNLEASPGYTAALDLDAVNGSGDAAVLFTDLALFGGLAAGSGTALIASFDTDVAPGFYQASYALDVSDEDILGAQPGAGLLLTLMGEVGSSAVFPFDGDGDGDVDLVDLDGFVQCLTGAGGTVAPACDHHDADQDGDVDLVDFRDFQIAFTGAL